MKYKVRAELSFSADVWVEAIDEDNACDIVSNSFIASKRILERILENERNLL